jgi:DNA replication protein DnaC
MNKTTKAFSPSVNITRDSEKEFNYIVTPNSKEIYKQIVSQFDSGVHSFSIIGSYGTGKSSFLVALKKNLIDRKNIFEPLNGELTHAKAFKFDMLVGRHDSLVKDVALYFGLHESASDKDVLHEIKKRHDDYQKKDTYWFLVIDEFGKYLEYAAKHNPEGELYFIQQLAEFANEQEKNMFLISTLHQAFDSYAFGLEQQQRKEWDKVKGRLKELAFNEPVEQLLFIASEHLKDRKNTTALESVNSLLSTISDAQVFPLKNKLDENLSENLYPLDPISGATLTLALQSYGQNERSLFSFLNSDDERGINNFKSTGNRFYAVAEVYDYLIYNHHSFLSSKFNPHYIQWNAIKNSLERTEATSAFFNSINDYLAIVKTIGLLNIFAASSARINDSFLTSYLAKTSHISEVQSLLSDLVKKKIIRFREFKSQYVLYDGTDFDIELEMHNASQKVELVKDVVPYVKQYFSSPYIAAKEAFYRTGTPRYFKFEISEVPFDKDVEQPDDGIINLVFGSSTNDVVSVSKENNAPVFYGLFQNVEAIRLELFEIHKIDYLLKHIESDKVAEKELRTLRASHQLKLDQLILSSIYSSTSDIVWIYKGEKIPISSQRSFNQYLSHIINDIYFEAPVYKNELINKNKVSPAVYRPRKELLRLLMENRYLKDLGFDPTLFPAEKTIYLSLLQNTGIHREESGIWDFYAPPEHSGLKPLWEASERFFESSKSGRKPLTDLIHELQQAPIGLKTGLIELWIPLYVIIKSNDCALYYEDAYVPDINYDVINLVFRNSKLFEIKAFNIDKNKRELFNKYRVFQNLPSEDGFSNKAFVETIRPFLLSFNKLNEYGRNTNKISEEARKLRDAIKTATDPEKAFFDTFPQALGYSNLESLKDDKSVSTFIKELDTALEEIEQSYNRLLTSIENEVLKALEIDATISFKEYLPQIHAKFSNIKEYRLADYQKKLLNRLLSPLNDREKWLNAIGIAFIDKPLPKLKDQEEEKLFYNLETRLHELESLSEIGKEQVDEKKEEAYQFELIPLGRKAVKKNIKISKKQLVDQKDELETLRKQLKGNKKKKIVLLLTLLEELTNNE